MNAIHKARTEAGLTQIEVGAVIGRSSMWMSKVERGVTQVNAAVEAKILRAIEKLAHFRESVREEQVALAEELRLPSPR